MASTLLLTLLLLAFVYSAAGSNRKYNDRFRMTYIVRLAEDTTVSDAALQRAPHISLVISWKEKKTYVEVRARTGQQTMDNILRERLARWLGHCDGNGSQQALHWQVQERTMLTKSEMEERTVNKDLQKMWFTGEEAEVAALYRHGWRWSVTSLMWVKSRLRSTL